MKAGELFMVLAGQYSDYGVYGTFRAVVDFSFDDELAKWLEAHPEQAEDYHFNRFMFLDSLVKSERIAHVTIPELHVDDYSKVNRTPEADWVRSRAEATSHRSGDPSNGGA